MTDVGAWRGPEGRGCRHQFDNTPFVLWDAKSGHRRRYAEHIEYLEKELGMILAFESADQVWLYRGGPKRNDKWLTLGGLKVNSYYPGECPTNLEQKLLMGNTEVILEEDDTTWGYGELPSREFMNRIVRILQTVTQFTKITFTEFHIIVEEPFSGITDINGYYTNLPSMMFGKTVFYHPHNYDFWQNYKLIVPRRDNEGPIPEEPIRLTAEHASLLASAWRLAFLKVGRPQTSQRQRPVHSRQPPNRRITERRTIRYTVPASTSHGSPRKMPKYNNGQRRHPLDSDFPSEPSPFGPRSPWHIENFDEPRPGSWYNLHVTEEKQTAAMLIGKSLTFAAQQARLDVHNPVLWAETYLLELPVNGLNRDPPPIVPLARSAVSCARGLDTLGFVIRSTEWYSEVSSMSCLASRQWNTAMMRQGCL